MKPRQEFQNFQVDHMTLLVQPELYKIAYIAFRVIFGVGPDDILYDKRKTWLPEEGEKSMTFAMRLGQGANPDPSLNNTIVALVQPTEPMSQSSHVREMLNGHSAAAHWQHIALRTPDLLAFHKHALDRGVQFITPILKDEEEDLIQVFSGEWYFPGSKPSAMFFEFLQRNPTDAHVAAIQKENNESWFRDKTFLGLYGEKEREYQSGEVTPFFRFDLFEALTKQFKGKNVWEIGDAELNKAEEIMLTMTRERLKK